MNIRQLFAGIYKLCDCGCGTLIPFLNSVNKPARFKLGHHNAGKIGPDSNNWRGGRNQNSKGYWRLYMPDYFSADKDGRVLEHIYFYQEFYDCCICKWAEIHHIIPVTKDYCNSMPWNLQAVMKGDHRRITHTVDMSKWFCSDCDSKETYIEKNGRPHWYDDHNGGHWCSKCRGKRRDWKQERLNKKN